jgi:septal ring factor EnvC (AmiA/AmiB activator)
MRRKGFVLGLSLLLLNQFANTAPLTQSQTQHKLQHLNEKIGNLKQRLDGVQHQHTDAEQTLAKIDKKMDAVVRQSLLLTQAISKKQTEIQKASQKAQTLSQQLQLHQIELMKHVRMIYMLGAAQPLKGMLMVNAPKSLDQWFVFYQYVIRSRRQLMDNIVVTKQALAQTQQTLKKELDAQAALKTELNQKQLKLAGIKTLQTQAVENLAHTIKTDQVILQDYERDKVNLSALLQHLLIQSQVHLHEVSMSNQQRIPSPIQGAYSSVKPWSQGLLFFSKEGTGVNAVQAGRVVFSDWLRGYGLLLILDHGGGWMSLYGYNQSLYKRVGQSVKAGEQIATVGHSGGRREDGLYFEVRRLGKVVAARHWLLARKET